MEPDTHDTHQPTGRPPWRGRLKWLKFVTGTNVLLSLGLATCLVVLVNYLAVMFPLRTDISKKQYYSLSDKTQSLISSLEVPVHIYSFLQSSHPLHAEVHNLLEEYLYEAKRHAHVPFTVEFIDPDRELARTRELKQSYDLQDVNVIVLDVNGRKQYLSADELSTYDRTFTGNEVRKRRTEFLGELVISSTIQGLIQGTAPIVYFLTGHGERNPESFDEQSGYSALARQIRRDNIEVRSLNLAQDKDVPPDASAVVIAGPSHSLSDTELEILGRYLDRGGRAMILVDPGAETGLETVLQNWGVRLGSEVVVGASFTGIGRELVITNYGHHPVTRRLSGLYTTFFLPRLVEPASPESNGTPDHPRVTPLAFNTVDGWAEASWKEGSPRFDAELDRQGPVSIAVASERGAVGQVDAQLKPSRLIVIGDSYFVANGGLAVATTSNLDFFLNAMNWLVSREELMAIGPKIPSEITLQMTENQFNVAFAVVVLALPGCIALVGLAVWFGRRS